MQLEIHGEGVNTLNLLEKARQRVKSNPNRYRYVWYDLIEKTSTIFIRITDKSREY